KSSKRCSSFPRISVVYNTGLLFLKENKKAGYRYLLLQRTEAAPSDFRDLEMYLNQIQPRVIQ
ncbi:hypothetical protein NPIL_410301, partial [Nephila pilipes]